MTIIRICFIMAACYIIQTPTFDAPMRFRVNNIYLVAFDPFSDTIDVCNFSLAEEFYYDNGILDGMSGWSYSAAYGRYDSYGINAEFITMNYTQYLEHQHAARRIQHTWRRFKAVRIIKKAWKNWLIKKNELWNPRCFVGAAYIALDACKTCKI